MKRESLIPSWLIWMPFISLCCLMAEARTSNTMLNNSGESEHPCLAPDLRGKALRFSPLRMILALGHSYMAFMNPRYDPSIPTFLRVIIKKGCYMLSNAFPASIERIMWFLSFIFDAVYHIDCFSYIEPTIYMYIWDAIYICIPDINPTWLWWIIILMYCGIQLTSIFLRIFASTFIGEIGL